MEVVQLTLTEACQVLKPPLSERQLTQIIRALPGITSAGVRHTGRPGHPEYTYPADDLLRLHAALSPWL